MPMSPSSSQRAFLDARLIQTRLVSEKVESSVPSGFSTGPQQAELTTNTQSTFSVALNDPLKPTDILIEVHYQVALKRPTAESSFVTYEAKHTAQFKLTAWTGFEDWSRAPHEALAPYLGMLNHLATQRAELALFDLGVRGATLPRVTDFQLQNGYSAPSAAPTSSGGA